MEQKTDNHYLDMDSIKELIEILDVFATTVLFSLGQHGKGIKDTIIRNFIARSIVSLKGILTLYEEKDYHDCWILHRCILDRLFHLSALVKDNSFELFEKWSLKLQYEFKNKVRSDPIFREKVIPGYFNDMEKKKDRYLDICKEKPNWSRPQAEKIAKEIDLDFLYKYGYDYASTFVHPMANDGDADFLRQTKQDTDGIFQDQRPVLTNSCLVVTVLIQDGLNASSLQWRAILYDFLSNCRIFLQSGDKEYLTTFVKIGSLGPDIDLCKKRD
jgi:hypothetical protein